MTHVGIIGAGSLGGLIAGLMHTHGHEVSVTARGANLTAIGEHGLRLTGGFGEHTARVRAAEQLPDVDLVILTVKTLDTEAALAANPIARERPVLVIQNGLAPHERAAKLLGHDRVAAGIATTAANLTGPGTVHITAAGLLFIGGPAADAFLPLIEPAVPGTSRIDDIIGAQWTKLVINMVNAVPALVGKSVQDTIATRALRRIVTASMRETVSVGAAAGARFAPLQGLNSGLLALLRHGPLAMSSIVPRRMARVMGDVPNLGSTQQSLLRGQRTEIDYLNGAVVEAAASAGTTAPVNAAITALMHEREQREGPLPVAEVVARVPLR